MLIIFVFFFIFLGLIFQNIFEQFLFSLRWLFYAFCNPRTKEIFFYFYNFYRKTVIINEAKIFFINWSYDSFVIVLPNIYIIPIARRKNIDTSFMVHVDICCGWYWLCILEFKIVKIGKWSLMSSLIIRFCKSWSIIVFASIWSTAVALAHVTWVGLLSF